MISRSCTIRFFLWIVILTLTSNAFRGYNSVGKYSHIKYGRQLRMTTESSSEKTSLEEMRNELNKSNYNDAYQILKRHPMMHISKDDAQIFLNHLDELGAKETSEKVNEKIEVSNFLYRRFQRQHVLRGFACVDRAYPENSTDISPLRLEELTGLSITALTPKQRTTYWRLAGVSVCIAEYIIGVNLGIDPVYTIIPGTFLLVGLDQLLYKGAYAETLYQTVFPEYKQKVICHEAGHFLIAYLLGLPVSNCITNAWDARKYPEIRGQAGTIFYDSKLQEEITKQKVSRSSLDRLSVVLMAGIAAEASKFGNAEGGATDEQELFSLLTQVQPPWNLIRIQGQARWAAVQALLLIKEHQAAFDALYDALCNNKSIGDCVIAIENHLPEVLPSLQRSEQKRITQRDSDRNSLVKYVQRLIYKVGGIEYTAPPSETSINEDLKISKDGYVLPPESSTSEATSVGLNSTDVAATTTSDWLKLQKFTDSIKQLQQATIEGKVNVTDKDASSGGGIWLNGLKALGDMKSNLPYPLTPSPPRASSSVSDFAIPKPLEGYEEKLDKLASFSATNTTQTSTDKDELADSAASGTKALLRSHRGFLMKRVENQQAYLGHQIRSIDERRRFLIENTQPKAKSSV